MSSTVNFLELPLHVCVTHHQHVAVELLSASTTHQTAIELWGIIRVIFGFFVWAMDPLCGTPCGSASVQPHVEVAEIKSNSQFSEP